MNVPEEAPYTPASGAPHTPALSQPQHVSPYGNGYGQPPPARTAWGGPAYHVTVPAKTGGIAVLLTLLWLGAGHLYAGKTTSGIVWIVTDLVLWSLWLIPFIGPFIWLFLWLPLFVVAAVTANEATKEYNRRLGLALH